MTTLKDWRGKEFTVGSTVIYPASLYGSAVEVVEGTVVEIDAGPKMSSYGVNIGTIRVKPTGCSSRYRQRERMVTLRNLHNVTAMS